MRQHQFGLAAVVERAAEQLGLGLRKPHAGLKEIEPSGRGQGGAGHDGRAAALGPGFAQHAAGLEQGHAVGRVGGRRSALELRHVDPPLAAHQRVGPHDVLLEPAVHLHHAGGGHLGVEDLEAFGDGVVDLRSRHTDTFQSLFDLSGENRLSGPGISGRPSSLQHALPALSVAELYQLRR